jgi:hypothetical protein
MMVDHALHELHVLRGVRRDAAVHRHHFRGGSWPGGATPRRRAANCIEHHGGRGDQPNYSIHGMTRDDVKLAGRVLPHIV